MSSLAITAIVLACLFGGALLGMVLRAYLPKHHLSPESTDVIKLATGLMATLAALVLGLLISSANTAHITVENEYTQSMADVAVLDRDLEEYGAGAQPARALLRRALVRKFQSIWPAEDFGQREPAVGDDLTPVESMQRMLLQLSPANDAQKWLLSQALLSTNNLGHVRWLLINQEAASTLPTPFLIVLVSWTTAIFISFGLFARPNATVFVSLFVSALAVSGAIFLIIELGDPFVGIVQVSSAPAHAMLNSLGK